MNNIDHKNLLKGYTKTTAIKSISPGDSIRYFVNNEFRYGGVVKINKYPNYLVLLNPGKNISWSLQLNNPTLIIYIKKLDKINKERKEKDKIYDLYKRGLLTKKPLKE
jgi:hypothetical protein